MEITRFKGIALAVGAEAGLSRASVSGLFKTGIDKGIAAVTDATDEEKAKLSRWMAGYAKHPSDTAKKPATKRSKRGKRGTQKAKPVQVFDKSGKALGFVVLG